MHSPTLPSTFFANELQQALAEQTFGIVTFDVMTSTSPLRATAFVTLLEGNAITITLSARGYHIESHKCILASPSKKEGKIFETVEELLQSSSSLYEQKRQEVLLKKLEKLS